MTNNAVTRTLNVIAEGRRAATNDEGTVDDHVYFQAPAPEPGTPLTDWLTVEIDRAAWRELGEPAQITITMDGAMREPEAAR